MMEPNFRLSEDEFYGVKDAMLQVQMVINLAALAKENLSSSVPFSTSHLISFMTAIERPLLAAVTAGEQWERSKDAEIRAIAERVADEAVADGTLPAELREAGINIGYLNLPRMRAWLNRDAVADLVPLPQVESKPHAQASSVEDQRQAGTTYVFHGPVECVAGSDLYRNHRAAKAPRAPLAGPGRQDSATKRGGKKAPRL